MNLLFFIILFISFIFIFLLEIIKRYFNIKSIYTRRAAHIFFFIIILISYFTISIQEALIILSIFFIIFCLSYRFYILSSIHIKEFLTYGEIIYIISFILLFIFWGNNPYVFVSASFILGFLDPISAFFNKSNKRCFKYNLKYLALCFLILSLIAFYYKEFVFLKILMIALTSAIIDRYSDYGLDNITTPMAVALFLS
ncbi:MAG: hypothetical protein PHU74_00705 [Candidatus Pacebacteria bacterium]|jgi:hypothetical protein|nr:hypothetical protein [Candidatus Paceibacterota bacterium]